MGILEVGNGDFGFSMMMLLCTKKEHDPTIPTPLLASIKGRGEGGWTRIVEQPHVFLSFFAFGSHEPK